MYSVKPLMLLFALTLSCVLNFSYAAYSESQLNKIHSDIKTQQKKKNFEQVVRLYSLLIEDSPGILPNYIYLARYQLYAEQPLQAKKTLDYLVRTKDMSSAPPSAVGAIKELYRQINQSLNQGSQLKSSKSALGKGSASPLKYSITLSGQINNNSNYAPNGQAELAKDKQTYTVNMNGLLQGSAKKIGKQKLQVNQVGFASVNTKFESGGETGQSISLLYKLQPRLHSDSLGGLSHQYPISLSYYQASDFLVMSLMFSPSLDFLTSHTLGYEVTATRNLAEKNTETALQQNIYYRHRKLFKAWAKPALSTKIRAKMTSFYKSADINLSLALKPAPFIRLTPSYALDFRFYPSELSFEQSNYYIAQTFQAHLLATIGEHWELGTRYKYRTRLARYKSDLYRQSIVSLSLGWSN